MGQRERAQAAPVITTAHGAAVDILDDVESETPQLAGEFVRSKERPPRLADRVYALARGGIVLEAQAKEADLPHRLEQAYMPGGSH